MRKKEASTLGETLQELVRSLGLTGRLREYDAVNCWPAVVGTHIAEVTEAKGIRNGELVVRVSKAAWRQELLLRKKELIERLNAHLGEEIVRDITLI